MSSQSLRRHPPRLNVIPVVQTSFPRKREYCNTPPSQDPDTSDRRLRGDD